MNGQSLSGGILAVFQALVLIVLADCERASAAKLLQMPRGSEEKFLPVFDEDTGGCNDDNQDGHEDVEGDEYVDHFSIVLRQGEIA
jgi:hypothetical protein